MVRNGAWLWPVANEEELEEMKNKQNQSTIHKPIAFLVCELMVVV